MSKVFKAIFLFFFIFSINFAFSNDEITIISREKWGANESYRYYNGPEWQDLIKKAKEKGIGEPKELTEAQKKAKEREKKANDFLLNTYPENYIVKEKITEEQGYELVWPIVKTKKNLIIVHHTEGKYKDSITALKSIYSYHTFTNGWGDIGYNYLIGLNGEIYEGRAGGDDVVGSHAKRNNFNSIGIAIIGSYDDNDINKNQEESLKNLINFLQQKHNINFSKKVPVFKECIGNNNCDEKPIIVTNNYPLIGHRDAGYTACPGDKLYSKLLKIRENLILQDGNFYSKLAILSTDVLLEFLVKIQENIDKENKKYDLQELNKNKYTILGILKEKYQNNLIKKDTSFDDNNKIKVKLSYPKDDSITVSFNGYYKPVLKKDKNDFILSFNYSSKIKNNLIKLSLKNNKLYFNNKSITGFTSKNYFRISSPVNKYLTISSWDRKPAWDSSGKLNDNKFKGDIIVYIKDSKLVIVNELTLTDYLKGLGEVSDSTNSEKIKTIIVSARTYARWYITEARKFPGEWYDASDDPNVFQKYLGYGLEERSPNINRIVDNTKDIIIKYNGKIIKPWYFSASNGKTKSFVDYCKTATGVPDCKNPEKFPFLSSVKDPGATGTKYLGHGVGIPGTGVEYFSNRDWDYITIIKYFLKGVDVGY